ncbi:MAG: TonB-dependent receptor [Tenuifilaceae bacterium]
MNLKILIIIFFIPILVQGQNISGFVKDSVQGSSLSEVNIIVNNKGTITDSEGFFTLSELNTGNHNITITCVGYKKQDRKVNITENCNITLEILMIKDEVFLDEIVVSATRTENRISQIPGRINMISSERLSLVAAQSVDEYLQFLPGVQVSRSFGIFSTKSSVTMRGLSGNEQARTLVLLDGIPVNKADGGSVNWNLISTGDVDKIEVVKGPGSALYGGNAMGGIINVKSKKPSKLIEGNLSAEYGTYNTKTFKVNLAGKMGTKMDKGFYWSTNTFYQKSDGYITQSEADQIANPFIVKSNVDEKALNIKTGYLHSKKFNAEVNISIYDGVRGTGEKVYQSNGNQTQYLTYQIRTSLNGSFDKINWNSSFFFLNENYNKVNEWFKDDYTWYNVFSVRRDFGLLSGISYSIKNHTLTSGFDIRNGQVDAYDIYYTSTDKVDNEGKMNFYGLYIQDDIILFKNFKLLAGIRYDIAKYYDGSFIIQNPSAETNYLDQYQFSGHTDKRWSAISPRISIQYKPSEMFRIYGGYSRGFRPSVLDDLCRTGRIRGGLKVANPNLKPEYLDNFELGSDLLLLKSLKFSASAYISNGKDFLYYVSTGDSLDMGFGDRPIMIRSNISNVKIFGSELDLSYNPTQSISLFGNYAYNHAKISDYKPLSINDPVNLNDKYLTDVPEHSFSLGVFIKNKYINAGITCRYTGEMYVNDQNIFDEIILSNKYPTWFKIDLKLSREIYKAINASLKIQNIMNKQIYESKGAVGPGRFITINIGVKI